MFSTLVPVPLIALTCAVSSKTSCLLFTVFTDCCSIFNWYSLIHTRTGGVYDDNKDNSCKSHIPWVYGLTSNKQNIVPF